MQVCLCPVCGKSFQLYPSQLKKRIHAFCSPECAHTPSIALVCKECGKSYLAAARGASVSVFCSRACRNARNRREEVHKNAPMENLTCQQCGRVFAVRRTFAKKGQRFCSKDCFWAHYGPKARKGADNPKWKPKLTLECTWCHKEFETFPSRAGRRRYCSKECAIADPETRIGGKPKITLTCQHCGTAYETYPSRASRKFCSTHCMGAWTVRHVHNPSSLEAIIGQLLTTIGIEFEPQKAFPHFVCDFFIPSVQLIIECDGTYWHSLPPAIVRDDRKDRWLTTNGYTVLRLPEDKIKGDLAWCAEQIVALTDEPIEITIPHQLTLLL